MLKAITASIAITASVAMGCPADCDGDGELTVLDFVCFQGLFLSGDEAADMNGDGILNILDFVAYQAAFQAGCPTGVKVIATGFAYDPDDEINPATILFLWDQANADILRPDDQILAYRGIEVGSGAKLDQLIADLPDVVEGEHVEFTIMRDEDIFDVAAVAVPVLVADADAPPTVKSVTFKDRDCEEVTVGTKEVCRCVDFNNAATLCTIDVHSNAAEDGKTVYVRATCSDSDLVSCDTDDLNKPKGK